jgi:hypothetical protein
MTIVLTVQDEDVGGQISNKHTLEFPTERLTVRDLIRGRIYEEVHDFNHDPSREFRGLIRPGEEETRLNGDSRSPRAKPINWKQQFDMACQAFEDGRILLLVDDRQSESLDDELELRPDSVATFLRLTLLVGG